MLERASGEYYRDYIADHVWGPAGMTTATFDPRQVIDGGNWASETTRDHVEYRPSQTLLA